jgi:hypothetical protein
MIKKVVLGCAVLSFSTFSGDLNAQIGNLKNLKNKVQNAVAGDEKKEKSAEDIEEDVAGASFSLDFDFRKNQLVYAEEFFKDNATIYQMEWDRSSNSFVGSTPYEPKAKGPKSKVFGFGKNTMDEDADYIKDIKCKNSLVADIGGKVTYYTNYDKGPSAWVRWSDKKNIEKNHGEGKKYTEQDALDYGVGFMFFDNIAIFVNYKRFDKGTIYRVDEVTTIYVTDKKAGKKLNPQDLKNRVEEYLVKGENDPEGFILGLSNQLEAEDRAINSNKGKDVKSLAVKTANNAKKVPVEGTLEFYVESILADGSKISTENKGYWDDFEITANGGVTTSITNGKIKLISNEGYGNFNPDDMVDEVVLTIKAVHHPNLQPVVIKLPVDYDVSKVTWNYNGSHLKGMRRAGIAAHIEVKEVKNTVDGSTLLEYRMRYRDENTWYQCVRIKPTTELYMHNNGGSLNGKSEGHGGNGGAGGDVKLVIDPSVKNYKFTASLKGGKGQIPKYANYSRGSDGVEGTMETVREKVNW